MPDIGKPRCEATVSPELVRLWRADLPRNPTASRAAPPSAVPHPPRDRMDGADFGTDGAMMPAWSLRVDGARPRRFRGLLLCAWRTTGPAPASATDTRRVRDLALYLAQDGTVIGHAAWHNQGRVTARPTFRAATITCPDDLERLIASDETGGDGDVPSGLQALRLSHQAIRSAPDPA